jgi:aminoglycoside phosphotransferase (APT) family kinase protein
MLLPPDADLARRDRQLPGLAILLDPEALAARLRRALARDDLGPARVTYVKYHPGVKCLVGYQLPVAEAEVQLYAVAHRPDACRELEKARTRPSVPGPLGSGRIVLEDCAVLVSLFPNDRKLKALPILADGASRQSLLGELLLRRPDLWGTAVQCLRYKPERRYVARVPGADGGAVIKAYEEKDYPAAKGSTGTFVSRGVLCLSRWLGHSDAHALLAFEWLPGRRLGVALFDPHLEPAVVSHVGAALAELHAQEPAGLARLTREAEAAVLAGLAATLGSLCPHLAARAERLARRLAACLMDEAPEDRPIHGDFHPGQVLVTGNGVALLDFDTAARGDPALDLGTFFAYLEHKALRGKISLARVDGLKTQLLHGYGTSAHPLRAAWIDLYTAANLLRRAPKPFRYRKPHWPEQIEALLARAEQLLRNVPPQAAGTRPGRGPGSPEASGKARLPARNPQEPGTGADEGQPDAVIS